MWMLEEGEEEADVLRPVVYAQADPPRGTLQGWY